MSAPRWAMQDDDALLGELRAIAGETIALLNEERRGIAALDSPAVVGLIHRKEALLQGLKGLALRAAGSANDVAVHPDTARDRDRRQVVTELVSAVIAEAEANAMLIADAVTEIARTLGVDPGPGTYSARARLSRGGPQVSPRAAKVG